MVPAAAQVAWGATLALMGDKSASGLKNYSEKMRRDWDDRASRNAKHYIADGLPEWNEDEFYASGETTVAQDILTDMENICEDRDPKTMRVFELGCGAGRVTRALAGVFGEVVGADISAQMVGLARKALESRPNASVVHIDGLSLGNVPGQFDFAYSCCVFHHISSYEVITGLVRDVGRLLRPGALFKFEVQGCEKVKPESGDTWLGVPFTVAQAEKLAAESGFELRYHYGAGEERFWLWFFKQ